MKTGSSLKKPNGKNEQCVLTLYKRSNLNTETKVHLISNQPG